MSMHKKPLTTIEETGLIAHGFGRDIGRPSMAADIFRTGVAWGQMLPAEQIASIQKQLEHGMPFDDKLRDRFSELLAILASQAQQEPVSKDWAEDFSHENGMYQSVCCACECTFIGHKRRGICKACAQPPAPEGGA